MTINWQWPNAIIFCVLTIVMGALIYKSKLPPEMIGALIAWLIPSPIKGKPTDVTPAITIVAPVVEEKS